VEPVIDELPVRLKFKPRQGPWCSLEQEASLIIQYWLIPGRDFFIKRIASVTLKLKTNRW